MRYGDYSKQNGVGINGRGYFDRIRAIRSVSPLKDTEVELLG